MLDLIPENVAAITARVHLCGWTRHAIKSLETAGQGNMNRTLRAHLDDGSSIILKQSLDHVAKYPDIAAPITRIGVEAAFYAAIAPHTKLSMNTPQLIGFDAATYMLAMQDLGSGSDLTDIYPGNAGEGKLACETLRQIVSWLSDLHAIAPPTDFPSNKEMRALNHEHIFCIPLSAETHAQLGAIIGPQARKIADQMVNQPELHARAQDLGRLYLGTTSAASQKVLLHGDFYPASWLRSDDGRVSIIDPEFAFVGPPEFDVGILMAHLHFAGFDRSAISAALESYRSPGNFELALAESFAGMEIIRRLLGVAQLPLSAEDQTKAEWLTTATDLLMNG
jgi:5-methylthioribose kinase